MSTTTSARMTRAMTRHENNDDAAPSTRTLGGIADHIEFGAPGGIDPPNQQQRNRPNGGPGDGGDDDGGGGGDDGPGNEEPELDPDQIMRMFFQNMADIARRGATPGPGATGKTKVNPPTEYDGSDTKKLRSFLLQCNLVFRANPTHYDTDEKKITFALTYLRGPAQQHFDPYLEAEMEAGFDPADHPTFMTNWREFGQELTTTFGDPNPEATAEAELDNLRMASSQKVQNFLVEFNNITSQLNWGQRALRHALYRSLPARLKDALSNAPHAETLQELKTTILTLDRRYWERHEEKSRELRASGTGNPSRINTPRSIEPPTRPSTAKTDLSNKLTAGKTLTQEERERRIREKLCMYCGKPGHFASECRLSQRNRTTRGRKAEVSSEVKETLSPASEGGVSERKDVVSEN